MSRQLEFVHEGTSDSGKTHLYEIHSVHDGSLLGLVRWYGPWRKYVVHPQSDALFDASCLEEIAAFLRADTDRHRKVLHRDKIRKGEMS